MQKERFILVKIALDILSFTGYSRLPEIYQQLGSERFEAFVLATEQLWGASRLSLSRLQSAAPPGACPYFKKFRSLVAQLSTQPGYPLLQDPPAPSRCGSLTYGCLIALEDFMRKG